MRRRLHGNAAAAVALLATAAGLALLLPAAAGSGSGARAADSDWVSTRDVGGSGRYVAFTVSLTGSGLTIAAAESFPWYRCPIGAGTVVYQFSQVGKNADGNKLYNGKGLGGVCPALVLGGTLSAVLQPGQDPFQTPKLAYGPDNLIQIYLGTYKAGDAMPMAADDQFYRKGGTSTSGGTTAGSSLVGKWRLPNGNRFRIAAIKGGFEMTALSAYKASNGCRMRKGIAYWRFFPTSGHLYKLAFRNYKGQCGVAAGWQKPKDTVKLVVSGKQLTESCFSKPTKACWKYTRV